MKNLGAPDVFEAQLPAAIADWARDAGIYISAISGELKVPPSLKLPKVL